MKRSNRASMMSGNFANNVRGKQIIMLGNLANNVRGKQTVMRCNLANKQTIMFY
jgi:hypothetical protein